MTGESPGRERQRGTSGEVADRRVPEDPRPTVVQLPGETHEAPGAGRAERTSDVPAERAPAALNSAVASASAASGGGAASAARPRPAHESTAEPSVDTPNGVVAVDDPAPQDVPPAPSEGSGAAAEPQETESNRDLDAGSDEAPVADAAETTNTADPSDTADAVVPAEAAESAAKRKSTPVAERDSWSEGDRESDVPAAGARAGKPVDEAVGASPAASGVAVPPTGSQALLEAPQAPGAPEADEEGPGARRVPLRTAIRTAVRTRWPSNRRRPPRRVHPR